MARKHDAQLPLRMSSDTLRVLKRIAKVKETEVQEMLRRAAYAIAEYAAVNGDKAVPLDMAITPINEPSMVEKVAEMLSHYEAAKKEEKEKK